MNINNQILKNCFYFHQKTSTLQRSSNDYPNNNFGITTSNHNVDNIGTFIKIQQNPIFQGHKKIIPKQKLIEVLELGLTLSTICELLGGISIPTLKKRLEENNLEYISPKNIRITDKITKEEFDRVYNMVGSPEEKAKELNISLFSFRKLERKFGYKSKTIKTRHKVEITKEEFARVHFDKTMNHEEKKQVLGISETTYYNLSKKFNLKSAFANQLAKNRSITESEFRAVVETDKPLKEKLQLLGIAYKYYRILAAKFGILTNNQKKEERLSLIDKNQFQRVFEMDIPQKDKCAALNITIDEFKKLAKRFGLKSKLALQRKHSQSITQEQFKEVYYLDILEREKWKMLGISHLTYNKLALKYGLKKDGNKGLLKNLSENEFRKIYEMNIPIELKLKMLNCKNANTYYALMAKFGIQSDKQTRKAYIESITKKQIEEILFSDTPEKEKLEKLDLTLLDYKKLLNKFGLLTEWVRKTRQKLFISKKTLTETISKNRTIKSVCNELQINYITFYKLIRKYNINYQLLMEFNKTKEYKNHTYMNFTSEELKNRLLSIYANEKNNLSHNIAIESIIDFLCSQKEYPLELKGTIINLIRQLDALEEKQITEKEIQESDDFKEISNLAYKYNEPYELKTKMNLLQETLANANMHNLQKICLKYTPYDSDLYNKKQLEASRLILNITKKYIDQENYILNSKDYKELANLLQYCDLILSDPNNENLKKAKLYCNKTHKDSSPLQLQQIINILNMLKQQNYNNDLANELQLFVECIRAIPMTEFKMIEIMLKLDNFFDSEISKNNYLNDFCALFNSGSIVENKIIEEYIQKIYINKETFKNSQESTIRQNFISVITPSCKQKVWNSKVNWNKIAFFQTIEKYMDIYAEAKIGRPGIKNFTLENGTNIAEIKIAGFNGARIFATLDSINDDMYIFNDFAPKGFHTNFKN